MMIIAYEYESAAGATIRKAVVGETEEEYKRAKARIMDVVDLGIGCKCLEFNEIMDSREIK